MDIRNHIQNPEDIWWDCGQQTSVAELSDIWGGGLHHNIIAAPAC